jgi:asparagine synthase (glutamine-hydrolysing)
VHEVLDERAVADAGVFDPRAVAQLWAKCQARKDEAQFSNTDNMALVGVLSTQILHQRLLRAAPGTAEVQPRTLVDRLA